MATASIGIAIFPDDGRDAGTLLKHADVALYSQGARREPLPVLPRRLNRMAQRRAEIDQQFAGDRIGPDAPVYQPSFAFGRAVAGLEALLRWSNPELGAVPLRIHPIAEKAGLIRRSAAG